MSEFLDIFRKNLKVADYAFLQGEKEKYLKAMEVTSQMLAHLVKHNKIEAALSLEIKWYSLVKKIENEGHYFNCFKNHAQAFWHAGKKLSPGPLKKGDEARVAFVVQNSVLLGHTEVMLSVMKNWREKYPHLEILFVGLTPCPKNLATRLFELNIEIVTPTNDNFEIISRVQWLRDALTSRQVGTAVWVSVPVWIPFIFGYGICARQVFWALKFHPCHMGEEVVHIGMTKKPFGDETINGKTWKAFQPPLAIVVRQNDLKEIEKFRDQFQSSFLFGTLAREEKFNSERFAQTVANILLKCPQAIYVYTGKKISPVFLNILKKNNVEKQAKFIGWVDTDIASNSIDCFLESFPFGCGVTGMQALSHGTKLISLWEGDTLPTYYFQNLADAYKYEPTWQVKKTEIEYIDAAAECYKEKNENKIRIEKKNLDVASLDEAKYEQLHSLIFEK